MILRVHKLREVSWAMVPGVSLPRSPKRQATTSTSAHPSKAAGDISSVFPSLSGADSPPLPPRFADLKRRLLQGHEERVTHSWHRLLADLRKEIAVIKVLGSKVIPELEFRDMHNMEKRTKFRDGLRKRGVGLIRGVVSEREALGWKDLAKRYIQTNPSTKGFPADNPAVYELYWSPSQVLARAHPNLLRTQAFLMSHWHSANKSAPVSTSHPVAYADRLRIRQPGDIGFALGPHVDGGSCERWEESGYGKGGVYSDIFRGNWEAYDPWESSCRLPVVSDLYNGPGGCSMFRMFQGWLSMSTTSAGEGTLMVNPLLGKATAYFLLRPFFQPGRGFTEALGSAFLDSDNWSLEDKTTSVLQGAVPSNCQELNAALHPHLGLQDTMIHVPQVRPGDYVAWHCDTIHAVDKTHAGKDDSSVMYIPACPLTEANAEYLVRQREAFFEGTPGPDFPSSVGESQHLGRLTPDFVMQNIDIEAQRAMGLAKYDASQKGLLEGERQTLERANRILGFEFVSPVFLNARATTDKCISLINRASRASANLVVFPESFIPAFPIWNALFAPTENHDFFRRMVDESLHMGGREIMAIKHAARKTRMVVSVGISEKFKTATMFNSNLIIAPDGEIVVHHRKLVPTFYEKLTWSPGDGRGLRLATTPFGNIGALICGENTNPLARYALMALGEQVHISSWPAIWPTRRSKSEEDKANGPPIENYDNFAANYLRSAAHCFEAKCFGISCAGHFSTENMDEILRISGGNTSCLPTLRQTPRAASMFLGPTGSLHPSFTIDEHTSAVKEKEMIQDEEDILYADLDLAECVEGKQYHDVIGGYQRLDVFDLRIDRSRRPPVSILTPKRILDEEERLASGSATMFIPENIGASSERYGARITSGLPWLRSQIEETSPGDEDATNKKEPRTGNLPTGYGNMDDAFDRALLFKKKQEAMSHGQPGGGPERTPLKIRRHIPLPVEKQEAISDGPPGGRPERTPLKRRYLFKPDEKD